MHLENIHWLAEAEWEEVLLRISTIGLEGNLTKVEVNAMSPHEVLSNDLPQLFYNCVWILMAYEMEVEGMALSIEMKWHEQFLSLPSSDDPFDTHVLIID